MLRGRTLATLLLAACGPAAATAPRPAATDPLVAALAADGVSPDRVARRTLYTWTTSDQVAELVHTNRLLVRDTSPRYGSSYVDYVVHALAAQGEPIAQLLDTTTYAKARFAWVSPWPTRLGFPGETYGNELIRVTLRPEAIVLALSTATGTFEAFALDGTRVDHIDPPRIAALYFVSDATRPAARGVPAPQTTYREYVLCNESMIESWEVGTADVRATLDHDANVVDEMARYLRGHPGVPPLADTWRASGPASGIAPAYAAALALDSPSYRDPAHLATLARDLRVPAAAAASGKPTSTFPGVGAARPAPHGPTNATYGTYIPRKRP